MRQDERPQIDEFALATAVRPGSAGNESKGPNQVLGKREQIASGRACGWRALAAGVLDSGIERAQGKPNPYHYNEARRDRVAVPAARQFVLSDWATFLAECCGLDLDMFDEHRAAWSAEWAKETAQHEGLPDSLWPMPRTNRIWGQT